MDTGIGVDDADPCWVANPYDAKEVTGTNTNIAYLCWMVKDATQTCDASSTDEDDGPAATSQGSCYEFATHAVTCDVAAADCVDLRGNQPVRRVQFFTKSFLGDDAAVLARSSGEEPASPRHRAGVASMAWRTTR